MSFLLFARSHGLNLDHIYASEKIKRCGTDAHPKSDNGAYYFNGERGWVMDWAEGAKPIWWNDPSAKPYTEAEKKEWAKQRKAKEHQQNLAWIAAAQRASDLLQACKPATHYYLNSKGLPDALGLVADTALVIPMRNYESNQLQGVQIIDWNAEEKTYDKKMNYGMRAKGAVLKLGPKRAAETFYCEGYATGLSIELAVRQLRLNAAVMVCFSASNMEYVAGKLKGKMFVVADNDKSKTGENTAKRIGAPYCMSDIEGEDANDLYQRAGLLPLCSMLMDVRRKPPP